MVNRALFALALLFWLTASMSFAGSAAAADIVPTGSPNTPPFSGRLAPIGDGAAGSRPPWGGAGDPVGSEMSSPAMDSAAAITAATITSQNGIGELAADSQQARSEIFTRAKGSYVADRPSAPVGTVKPKQTSANSFLLQLILVPTITLVFGGLTAYFQNRRRARQGLGPADNSAWFDGDFDDGGD